MTFPNRSNETYPDIEQEKRAQARQASAFAAGETDQLPAFATKGPDATVRDGEYVPADAVVVTNTEPEIEVTPEAPVVGPTPVEPTPAPTETTTEPIADEPTPVTEPDTVA